MKTWDLLSVHAPNGTRDPLVLHSDEGARAVLIVLQPGQALGEHQVKENAWVTVLDATVEISASEPRERLLAFVDEVVRPLPHVRQRENALLYVRGLIEHGGRKSLQPTLFRLDEAPARYESLQQFLADSPWRSELLVRGCVERVAAELGVVAWVVDDTGIVKDGKHSPG